MEKYSGHKEAMRPFGGREDDMADLNDWTITDIATSANTAPEDRKNANAEIARREEAGVYDPDDASQDIKEDLLSHGYGVENGKIYYPTPEYKEWLQSDRSEPRPDGTIKESIAERVLAERDKALEEQKREQNRQAGEAMLSMYENEPSREKIFHSAKNEKESFINKRMHDEDEKEHDILMNEKRRFKRWNMYDNSFSNPKRMNEAENRADMPIFEEIEEPKVATHEDISLDQKIDRLYNVYEDNFSKKAPKWISFGVSNLLERGVVNPPVESLLRNGFWSHEEEEIHDKIDPNDSLSEGVIDAEMNLKARVTKDLIDKKSSELSKEDIEKAKREGYLYAISSGAHIDKAKGRVSFSIPVEYGKEVEDSIKEVGIDPNSEKARRASYDGFINIIDAIKANKKFTEKGFKTLDWYFDTFGYKSDFAGEDGFLDTMWGYQSSSDAAWSKTFDSYLQTRPEYAKYIGDVQDDKDENGAESLRLVKEQNEEEIQEGIANYLGCSKETLQDGISISNYVLGIDGEILPPDPFYHGASIEKNNPFDIYKYPKSYGKAKEAAMYAIYVILKESGLDPSVQYFRETEDGSPIMMGKTCYTVLRFGCKKTNGENENNAIVESNTPAAATWLWRGHGDDWQDVFIGRYKREAKAFPNVDKKNHDHTRPPIAHLVDILEGMGVDIKEAARIVKEQSEKAESV